MPCRCSGRTSVASSTSARVQAGGTIPLGEIVGRECCRHRLVNDGIVSRGCADMVVTGTVTMRPAEQASAAVPLSAELRRNGQPVRGGSACIDSTATVSLPFRATVQGDPCNAVTVTLVNTGAEAVVDGVSLDIDSE